MLAADYIVDIGPKAGEYGGEVVATGTAKQIMKNKKSITGAYFSGKIKIPVPQVTKKTIRISKSSGAQENNLKNIDVNSHLEFYLCNRSFWIRKEFSSQSDLYTNVWQKN